MFYFFAWFLIYSHLAVRFQIFNHISVNSLGALYKLNAVHCSNSEEST